MKKLASRTVRYFVVHCTGTDKSKTAKDFYDPDGKSLFHYVIDKDGEVRKLCGNRNIIDKGTAISREAIHIAYIGGVDENGKPVNNINKMQQEALLYQLVQLSLIYHNIETLAANEIDPSTFSPCFDVKMWMRNYEPNLSLDINEMGIAA